MTYNSNGIPMGVAGNIFEHVIRSFYRYSYTDHPLVGVEFVFK